MDLGLRGRKALVTGASKGIGRACAEILAEEGCDIVLVSRTAADLEAVRAKIVGQHNIAVRFYPLDLSDSRNVDKLAAECGCPVVPIVVDGTWPIYSGWKVKAFPGLITVRVLDPVTLSEAGGSVLRFRDLVFERMKETLAEIRATKMPPPMSPPVPRTTQAVTQPHWTGQN